MNSVPTSSMSSNPCRVLSLDGGGAKGFYTLGVLNQVEAMLGGKPLCQHFNLIFGTSTGAIIAALLALGYQVSAIFEPYKTHVPTITRKLSTRGRTKALAELVEQVFGKADFTQVKTGVGIVASHRLTGAKRHLLRVSVARLQRRFVLHVLPFHISNE